MASALKERKNYRIFEIVSKTFCMIILGFLPIWVDTNGYSAITECKFKTFRFFSYSYFIVVIAIIAVCLIRTYLLHSKVNVLERREAELPLQISLPQIIILIYVIWNAISAITSKYGKDTWLGQGRFEGMLSVILYSFVFILVSCHGEYSKWYSRVMTMAVVFFCILGYAQLFKEGVIYPDGYSFWEARFVSTIGNVDMVGGYVSLVLPVMFCSFVYSDTKIWDYVYLGTIALLTYLFILSDVDSGKVGLAVGLIFAFCFLVDERKHLIRTLVALGTFAGSFFLQVFLNQSKGGFKPHFGTKALVLLAGTIACFGLAYFLSKTKFSLGWSKEKARKIALVLMICVIVICLLFIFFYNGDNRLLADAHNVLHFNLTDDAGSGRGYIWKSAWGLAKETPIKGNGPGTFGESYKHLDTFDTYTDFAHNDFVQIAVCIGFVGLAIYVAFLIAFAWRALKNAAKCEYIVIFASGCAAYLAHSFFSFSLAIITPSFWVMAGIVDKLVKQLEE